MAAGCTAGRRPGGLGIGVVVLSAALVGAWSPGWRRPATPARAGPRPRLPAGRLRPPGPLPPRRPPLRRQAPPMRPGSGPYGVDGRLGDRGERQTRHRGLADHRGPDVRRHRRLRQPGSGRGGPDGDARMSRLRRPASTSWPTEWVTTRDWVGAASGNQPRPRAGSRRRVRWRAAPTWSSATGVPLSRSRSAARGYKGQYLLKLVASGGQQSYIPLTVWDPASHATYVLMAGVLTDQAFNPYGSYDLYQGATACAPDMYPARAGRAWCLSTAPTRPETGPVPTSP